MREFSQDAIASLNKSIEHRGLDQRIAKIVASSSPYNYTTRVVFTDGTDIQFAAPDPVEAGKKLSRFVRLGKL